MAPAELCTDSDAVGLIASAVPHRYKRHADFIRFLRFLRRLERGEEKTQRVKA